MSRERNQRRQREKEIDRETRTDEFRAGRRENERSGVERSGEHLGMQKRERHCRCLLGGLGWRGLIW